MPGQANVFSTACGIAISNNYDTVGTLTKASIAGLTPTQLKTLFSPDAGTRWYEMSAMLKTQFEMAACGVRRYCMYDWIMSSNRPGMGKLIQTIKRDRGSSLVQPFILGRQISVVNADYWVVTTGYATGSYTPGTTGPLTSVAGGDRIVRVISGYSVPLDPKYFLPKHDLYILNRKVDGTAQRGQWMVVDAAIATDGSYVDILVANRNSADTTVVDAAPVNGVLLIGINNVNDYEKYCYNPVNVNPLKFVPFWYQPRRRARRVDSAYMDLFKKLMEDNQYFAQFQDLPLAERNRQDELTDEKQFVNSFFWSRAYSNAQVLDGSPNWTNLPQIPSFSGASVDPGTGGQLQAYRANQIGVYDQLRACNRVKDLQNQMLNIKNFCESDMYDIYRSRNSQGQDGMNLDIYTDSISADQWMVAFIKYAKAKLGDIIRINIEEGTTLGFNWRRYKLFRPQGVIINILTNEYFDDMVNTFANLSTGEQASRGRVLACLDIGKGGSIYPAILGSNRKSFETGRIEELAKIDASYSCVMENPTIKTTLSSEITSVIVECPLHSLWTENFSTIDYA